MMPLRVLVAEDNEDHRYLLTRALRKAAMVPLEIREARDGEETLSFLRGDSDDESRPHVVFLDLQMPGVDGFEVLRQVKTDPVLANIPIVVLTASSRREDIDAAYGLGGNCYVTKGEAPDGRDSLPRLAEYWTTLSHLPQIEN